MMSLGEDAGDVSNAAGVKSCQHIVSTFAHEAKHNRSYGAARIVSLI